MKSLDELKKEGSAVLLYFFSPSCAACTDLNPKIEEMVNKSFPKFVFYKVNAFDNPELAASASVFSAPAILIFFEGKEYIRESKYISVRQLSEKIRRYYDMVFS